MAGAPSRTRDPAGRDAPRPPLPSDDFAAALRNAIASRGMSLGQIRRVLAESGVQISVASLSYWQSGRSVPERPMSLAAIAPLERCLDLPRGFLSSRLPQAHAVRGIAPYAHGRLTTVKAGTYSHIDNAVAELGMGYGDLTYVAVHDRLLITEEGENHDEVSLILEARRDGVTGYPVFLQADEEDVYPVVEAVLNTRVGRVVEFRDLSAVAVEMSFDRPLAAGESIFVEHRHSFVGGPASRTGLWRRVTSPSMEVVMEARFEGRMPRTVAACRGPASDMVSTPLTPASVVQAHFFDEPPGVFGLTWEF